MKRDQFEKLIGFRRVKRDFGIDLIGGVTFEASARISDEFKNDTRAIKSAEENIKSKILREVYDDHRKAFIEKINELEVCEPLDWTKRRQIIGEIVSMAKAL